MKIIIEEKSDDNGGSFYFFWRGHTVNLIQITPSCHPGYSWCVSHPGRVLALYYFRSLKQARQFALTAAVLMAHGRPIPIQ